MKIIPLLQWPIKSHSFVKTLLVFRSRNYLSPSSLSSISLTLQPSHTIHILSETNAICGRVMHFCGGSSLEVQSGVPLLALHRPVSLKKK